MQSLAVGIYAGVVLDVVHRDRFSDVGTHGAIRLECLHRVVEFDD